MARPCGNMWTDARDLRPPRGLGLDRARHGGRTERARPRRAGGGGAARDPRGRRAPAWVLPARRGARRRQRACERTGGLHATALFEPSGELIELREDVGRHNAMDKAIGAQLLARRYPLAGVYACVSGRASFELV